MSLGLEIDRTGPSGQTRVAMNASRNFSARHRFATVVLWLHVPVLAVMGWAAGMSPGLVGAASLILVALGVAGTISTSPILAASITSLGLMATSAIAAATFDSTSWAHLHFVVMLTVISVYRDWRPLAIAIIGAGASHLLIGSLPGPDRALWALGHTLGLALIAAILVTTWRFDPARRDDASQLYEISFHQAPIGMALAKPSGELLAVNRALATLLGTEPGKMVGAAVRSIFHGDDMSTLGDAWAQMAATEERRSSARLRCTTQSGGDLWARVSLALAPWSPEQNAVVLLQVQETKEAKAERLDLERLLDDRDRFVATVGNELLGPLSTLLDLTSEGDPRLLTIAGHAREAASIVDDLVASARPEALAATLPQTMDVEAVCREVTASIREAGHVSIEVSAPTLWADERLTRQILFGLIHHAVRYGGPVVQVKALKSGPDTVIQVIDDGPMIPAGQRERMFSADLRHGPPVTQPASVGLSLTVGRRLARHMDGDIVYRRTADGQNVFELRLPCVEIRPLMAQRRMGQMRTSTRS